MCGGHMYYFCVTLETHLLTRTWTGFNSSLSTSIQLLFYHQQSIYILAKSTLSTMCNLGAVCKHKKIVLLSSEQRRRRTKKSSSGTLSSLSIFE